MTQETQRQLAHLVSGLPVVVLPYIERWQLLSALVVVTVVACFGRRMPLFKKLYRPATVEQKNDYGSIYYFGTLFLLGVVIPLPILGASWAILAGGDSLSTLVGLRFPRHRLPWNKNKSWAGTIAFFGTGLFFCSVALWWLSPTVAWPNVIVMSSLAAVAAALVESLPWQFDDNCTILLASSLVLWISLL